jgi:hypothetical protein
MGSQPKWPGPLGLTIIPLVFPTNYKGSFKSGPMYDNMH